MENIQIAIPGKVRTIINVLKENGYEAYIVGGCVRDAILGKEPDDWDITTSALPETVKKLFPKTIETGIKHGTITILIEKESFEVTTYRIDGEYYDNRHPKEVLFTPELKEDLRRRDFTINAMAYNDKEGLVDVFGGIHDLNQKIVRCVGNPEERFMEDALRILRAVRFSSQLGFVIENTTKEAMKKLSGNLSSISYERIQAELVKLLVSDHPEELKTAYELGITKEFLPEFDNLMSSPYGSSMVGIHTINTIKEVKPDKALRLAMLCHEMEGPELVAQSTKRILKRLRFDNHTLNRVTRLVKWHNLEINAKKTEVRRAIFQVGEDIFGDLIIVKKAHLLADNPSMNKKKEKELLELFEISKIYQEILDSKDCVSLRDLKISGKDLIEEGLKPGLEIGNILDWLLEMVIENPEYNEKEYLMSLVRRYLENNSNR